MNPDAANEKLALVRLARTRTALKQIDTGQVIDGEAVLAWVASWGTTKEARALTQMPDTYLFDELRICASKNQESAKAHDIELFSSMSCDPPPGGFQKTS